MEQMPHTNPGGSSIERDINNTEKEALAKRAKFKADLEAATTLEDVRAAVEAFSVEDEMGRKVVVNFMEGGVADENVYDGAEPYDDVMRGIDTLEKNGASSFNEVSSAIFNYAVANRIAEILGVN